MSVQTLYTAATGMEALETKLDVIANNLANVNTSGFKKGRVNFEDLFYDQKTLPGTEDSAGNLTATGTAIGLGTRVSSVQTDHRQGAFQVTNNPLDVAIVGNGFLQVLDANGETLYTRTGHLSVNANGNLVLGSANAGRPVEPSIQIPDGYQEVSIGQDGAVKVRLAGQTDLTDAGQIQIATFINPDGLLQNGENLFQRTEASGAPTAGNPSDIGFGKLQSNTLEASNVEPVQELIDLITTQRSFELNSQAVQAGDEILQLVANLRRY